MFPGPATHSHPVPPQEFLSLTSSAGTLPIHYPGDPESSLSPLPALLILLTVTTFLLGPRAPGKHEFESLQRCAEKAVSPFIDRQQRLQEGIAHSQSRKHTVAILTPHPCSLHPPFPVLAVGLPFGKRQGAGSLNHAEGQGVRGRPGHGSQCSGDSPWSPLAGSLVEAGVGPAPGTFLFLPLSHTNFFLPLFLTPIKSSQSPSLAWEPFTGDKALHSIIRETRLKNADAQIPGKGKAVVGTVSCQGYRVLDLFLFECYRPSERA